MYRFKYLLNICKDIFLIEVQLLISSGGIDYRDEFNVYVFMPKQTHFRFNPNAHDDYNYSVCEVMFY